MNTQYQNIFTEKDIGKRVISLSYGLGTLKEFGYVTEDDDTPVGVIFDKFGTANVGEYLFGGKYKSHIYFYADGRCCIHRDNTDCNIKLYTEEV